MPALAQWIIPTVIVRNLKATALGISIIALKILSQHKPVLTFPYFVEGDPSATRASFVRRSYNDETYGEDAETGFPGTKLENRCLTTEPVYGGLLVRVVFDKELFSST